MSLDMAYLDLALFLTSTSFLKLKKKIYTFSTKSPKFCIAVGLDTL